MPKYFYLSNLDIKSQEDDYLCWAACGSMLAKFYNITHKSSKQVDFLNTLTNKVDCSIEARNCNVDIEKSEISSVFQNWNLNCVEKNINHINQFEWVKNEIDVNKNPLLLGIETESKYKHLVIVYGYGICKDKEYLLIADPKTNVVYSPYNNYGFHYDDSKFNALWRITLLNNEQQDNTREVKKTNSILEIVGNSFNNGGYKSLKTNLLVSSQKNIRQTGITFYNNDGHLLYVSKYYEEEECYEDEFQFLLVKRKATPIERLFKNLLENGLITKDSSLIYSLETDFLGITNQTGLSDIDTTLIHPISIPNILENRISINSTISIDSLKNSINNINL